MSNRKLIESATHVFESNGAGLRCYKSRWGDCERGATYSAEYVAALVRSVPQAAVLIVKEVR